MSIVTKIIITAFVFFFIILSNCGPGKGRNIPLKSKIKFNQYYVNGKRLYNTYCSNCHQRDGSGLSKLYPPILGSALYKSSPDQTICIIRNGLKGEIIVNGVIFNQPMPENQDLTPLEIAELVTYLYSNWGEMNKVFNTEEVMNALQSCSISGDN